MNKIVIVTTVQELTKACLEVYQVRKSRFKLERRGASDDHLALVGCGSMKKYRLYVEGELARLLARKWSKKESRYYRGHYTYVGIRTLVSLVYLLNESAGKGLEVDIIKRDFEYRNRERTIQRLNTIRYARELKSKVDLLLVSSSQIGFPSTLDEIAALPLEEEPQ